MLSYHVHVTCRELCFADLLGYMSYSLLTILKNCFRHTVTGNGSINSNDKNACLVSLYGH